MSYLTGASYEGYFRNGKRHGIGTQINADGVVIHGTWDDGELVDQFNSDEFEEQDYNPESESEKSSDESPR